MLAFLKNLPVKILGGRCLSVWGPLLYYDPILHHPYILYTVLVYSVLFIQGWWGGGGELAREKAWGAMLHKAGQKYQHDWLYLQSSIKHQ